MKKLFIIIPVALVIIATIPFIFRFAKDIKKKKNYANTFAIQNIQSSKDIRVHNANYHDDARIILYPHHEWECITWEFIEIEYNTFLLKNLYTQKTFEPMQLPSRALDCGKSRWVVANISTGSL